MLAEMDILKIFDYIVKIDDVEKKKPHPEIFNKIVDYYHALKIEYVYNIYEEPTLELSIQKQDTENLDLDFQHLENDTQLNTNKQNMKEQKDKVDKIKNNHNFLTIDLIDRKYISIDDTDIYNYDRLFKELLNEYETSEILMILHYIIPRVLERNFMDENGEKILNKFGYLKQSILNNIDKLKNNEIEWDNELGWFKENGPNQEKYAIDM